MATKTGSAVAPIAQGELPTDMDLEDILGDAGVGSSDMGAADLGIPYLTVLQSNSPQVNPAHAKYVEGALAGMFYNTATGAVFPGKDGVTLVPCAYDRQLVQWKDRDLGEGGFVMTHEPDSDVLSQCKPNAKGKPALPNGDIIWETAYQYALMQNPLSGRWDQVVVALKSTMLKKNRRWNNLIADATIPGTDKQAPRWLFPYTMRTVLESKGNNSWFSIEVERQPGTVTADVYKAGKKFHNMFSSGQVQRASEASLEDDAPAAGAPAGGGSKLGDDEIPF